MTVMRSPVFCARFADGVETRMTVWHDDERKTFDLVRGMRLAHIAYRSRTGKEPVQMIAARYEREGETLQEYNIAQLDNYTVENHGSFSVVSRKGNGSDRLE